LPRHRTWISGASHQRQNSPRCERALNDYAPPRSNSRRRCGFILALYAYAEALAQPATSAVGHFSDIAALANVRFAPILLKKSKIEPHRKSRER
jgi:hypothetical protein